MRPSLRSAALLASLFASQSAWGQDFNIDIGPAGNDLPDSSYAAAGLAGTWNSLLLPHTTPSLAPQAFDEFLVDLAGNLTAVRVHQFGGQAWSDEVDPSLTGNDDALLGDALLTNSLGLDSCLYINGLQNGTYEVLTYMWRPNHPEVIHKSKYDTVPGQQDTTGDWSGVHQEGVTFTRTIVEVTNGFMGPHMGLTSAGNAALGGAVNGMQIRLIDCSSNGFCSSSTNSAGGPAKLSSNGDCSVEANVFELIATPVPNQFGMFLYASGTAGGGAGVPLANGLLCVGGGTTIYRLGVTVASGNTLSHVVDFTQPNGAGGAITAGSSWHFQAWFRDPAAGGANADLSDGLTVLFH